MRDTAVEVSDVLRWTPSYGHESAGQLTRKY